MNIVAAQLKKDIQCQRRLLIAWGICAAISIVVTVALFGLSLLGRFSHVPMVSQANPHTLMLGALTMGGIVLAGTFITGSGQFLLLPLLVVRIVQEDKLLGTTAFWRTRPVPRGQLLAAKALLIAILPLPLLWLGGTGARFGSGHFWAAELAWLAAFAAISSITSGAKDFLIYAVVLLFGKGVFGNILTHLWSRLQGNNPSSINGLMHPLSAVLGVLHLDGPDFYHLCYFAGFCAVFVHQYLTLQTRKSLAILIGIIGVISLLQMPGGLPADVPIKF